MAFIDKLVTRAKNASKHIVLPEGQDPRVVLAANKIHEIGIATVTVLGTEAEIKESCAAAKIGTCNFRILDHTNAECLADFAETFRELRKKRGKEIGTDAAIAQMKDRIFFGNMMLRKGMADGLVAGSIASTPDMLRGAFMVTGTAPGIKSGSSCFVMDLKTPSPGGAEVLLYADSGVNPDPDEEQLVDIAMATATTYRALTGAQPKIAFLSFSTRGSAEHESLKKIIAATAKTKARVKEAGLDILVDGELQADAAIVPGVAAKKCPDSPLKGEANVLIFPDLNAGNICYKLTERLAGAGAYGPILQGLAKPVNDLSRGCSADDIVGVAAITVCQAIG
jgi:phosphate acetyltransferase